MQCLRLRDQNAGARVQPLVRELDPNSTCHNRDPYMLCRFSRVRLFVTPWTSSPGSSVHGILQAGILEWVAFPFSKGSCWPRDQNHTSYVFWTLSIPGVSRETAVQVLNTVCLQDSLQSSSNHDSVVLATLDKQINGTEQEHKIVPDKYSQLTFDKGVKAV